jgi:hypothetical protein
VFHNGKSPVNKLHLTSRNFFRLCTLLIAAIMSMSRPWMTSSANARQKLVGGRSISMTDVTSTACAD